MNTKTLQSQTHKRNPYQDLKTFILRTYGFPGKLNTQKQKRERKGYLAGKIGIKKEKIERKKKKKKQTPKYPTILSLSLSQLTKIFSRFSGLSLSLCLSHTPKLNRTRFSSCLSLSLSFFV